MVDCSMWLCILAFFLRISTSVTFSSPPTMLNSIVDFFIFTFSPLSIAGCCSLAWHFLDDIVSARDEQSNVPWLRREFVAVRVKYKWCNDSFLIVSSITSDKIAINCRLFVLFHERFGAFSLFAVVLYVVNFLMRNFQMLSNTFFPARSKAEGDHPSDDDG